MPKPYNSRIIMVVAQQWFEPAEGQYQFCKLVPLVYVDGERPEPVHFLNDGEVWWMLTAATALLAAPGRLVVGELEDAVRFERDDPHSSSLQVIRESLREVPGTDAMQIIDVPADAVSSIHDVVARGFNLPLRAAPTPQVLLRFRGHVYGPFTSTLHVSSQGGTRPGYEFKPSNQPSGRVYQFDEAALLEVTDEFYIAQGIDVSLTRQRRTETRESARIRVELLLREGFNRLLNTNPAELTLRTMEHRLVAFAKDLLSRKRRQELQRLLEELESSGRETASFNELRDIVKAYSNRLAGHDEALEDAAKALLQSGYLGEDRIEKAQRQFAEDYVKQKSAELEARVQENIAARNTELQNADRKLKELQRKLDQEEASRKQQAEQELARARAKHEADIAADRADLQKAKKGFEREQAILKENLEKVTRELRESGDEVLNRYLTILPLLGTSSRTSSQFAPVSRIDDNVEREPTPEPSFELPTFITSSPAADPSSMEERAFFERFVVHVENRGFVYRELDLMRFHLSVKCGDMTVLGGPSGTGKSSLPILYTEALMGDQGNQRPGCLMVNVNPSWMEVRDLLGHLNTIEGRFYPAESGLYQHLIFAQEEHHAKGQASLMYIACLDEMNLAQIEHYFSDLMMVLEREGRHRAIRCFVEGAASSDCQFRKWSSVLLSPALRFVGTVNFDETTRLLSDRFLDRVNLIELSAEQLPVVTTTESAAESTVAGPALTLEMLNSWVLDAALPSDIGQLVDVFRPLLRDIGAPLSSRVYRGMCRFVNSSKALIPAAKAFDLQIAQRVIPRIRTLVSRTQLKALDTLIDAMRSSTLPFEESLPMLEAKRDGAISPGWDGED